MVGSRSSGRIGQLKSPLGNSFVVSCVYIQHSYHYNVEMAQFEALYRRRCRSPNGWFDTFEMRPWVLII